MKCPLCGGSSQHGKMLKDLCCPYCSKISTFEVDVHCPGGVSHGESHECPNCLKEISVVIYYDGNVCANKPIYTCDSGTTYHSFMEISLNHNNKHGWWYCKDKAYCISKKVSDEL